MVRLENPLKSPMTTITTIVIIPTSTISPIIPTVIPITIPATPPFTNTPIIPTSTSPKNPCHVLLKYEK